MSMNWTLREKSPQEIKREEDYMRGYARGGMPPKACPLEVTFFDGSKCDVWDLTEQKIVGLIKAIVNDMEHLNKDRQRIAWAMEIVACWGKKHPDISNRMTAELLKVEVASNNPAIREVVRDFMGPIANDNIAKAKSALGVPELSSNSDQLVDFFMNRANEENSQQRNNEDSPSM